MYKESIYFSCFCLIFCLVLTNIGNAQLDPSLMGWWKLDETSGSVASDSSGNARDGTTFGGPQWITGQLDGALQFDGDDDYVELPIGSVVGTLTNISCSAWVNFTGQLGGTGHAFLISAAVQRSTCSSQREVSLVRVKSRSFSGLHRILGRTRTV